MLGELLFGIVLGNFGLTGSDIFEVLKTEPLLPMAAEIGAILLLFHMGLESDLGKLLTVGRAAVSVALRGSTRNVPSRGSRMQARDSEFGRRLRGDLARLRDVVNRAAVGAAVVIHREDADDNGVKTQCATGRMFGEVKGCSNASRATLSFSGMVTFRNAAAIRTAADSAGDASHQDVRRLPRVNGAAIIQGTQQSYGAATTTRRP